MGTSTRSRRWLGAIFVVTLSSVTLSLGCSQPGSVERGGLTAPSLPSDGAQTSAKTDAPDASGIWSGSFSIGGSGCISVTQQKNGDLSAFEVLNTGDPEPSGHTYTFNRQGNPKKGVVDYNVSIIGSPGQTCVDTVSGTAQFDPTAQMITAQLSGLINVSETACATLTFTMTAHRDILANCPSSH